MPPANVATRKFPCTWAGCRKLCKSTSGRARHIKAKHAQPVVPAAHDAPHAPPDAPAPYLDPEDLAPEEDMQNADLHHHDPDPAVNHPEAEPQPTGITVQTHERLTGDPCNAAGQPLPPNTPPTAPPRPRTNDYGPYENRAQFEIADFLFRKVQMSGNDIDGLMQLWSAYSQQSPFADRDDLYTSIDSVPHGDIPWKAFVVTYTGPRPAEGAVPPWMEREYTVWYRCSRAVLHSQLGNRDFAGEMDFAPKKVHHGGERVYEDFMTGDWCWKQADEIAEDPRTHGSVFCPVILGSDKTTVSVATGQNEYYPLYLSNGLVHNTTRRAQRNAVSLLAFLAIPKTDREFADDANFRKFRRQLFHTSLQTILQSLEPGMTVPEVVRYGDGHFRRTVYGLGPYIADYPEQALLACIVQGWCAKYECDARRQDLDGGGHLRSHEITDALLDSMDLKALWDDYGIVGDLLPFTVAFPRADIHEMLSPDLLHQIIKGTFKDHLVTWVEEYLVLTHGKTAASVILADIDRRIAAAPHFPGLRRFPEGRGFKQWTGDDSKALMKVYLHAIVGYVPPQMVQCLSAFLDFCYLVRRNVITTTTLLQIEDALARFHRDRTGVRLDGFSLPRQHSLKHYPMLIQLFGAPNGLCSSITESKHIKAVKEPYRRSNRFEALGQMLITNQRLDKLAAARVDFTARGMLNGPCLPTIPEEDAFEGLGLLDDIEELVQLAEKHLVIDEDEDDGPVDTDALLGEVVLAKRKVAGFPSDLGHVAHLIHVPQLPNLIRRFLYSELNPGAIIDFETVDIAQCPQPPSRINVFPSAVALFHAPSDLCGAHGMKKERIRAVRSWRGGPARYDCAFVTDDETLPGFRGLAVVRVLLFFSFKYANGITYPCALVSWFVTSGNAPCEETGMWIVEPQVDPHGRRVVSVIHLDCMLRAAHLLPVPDDDPISTRLRHTDTLDAFEAFYVNKYADHHAHEIAF
ncbi:hypothetical protein C8Q76DRAFT_771687 [Earliella scabrosa]|nr:hypothetical protein C8Q76DRAFT_771687 [Earliella scabrosa]